VAETPAMAEVSKKQDFAYHFALPEISITFMKAASWQKWS
jgi:hypothetical protein